VDANRGNLPPVVLGAYVRSLWWGVAGNVIGLKSTHMNVVDALNIVALGFNLYFLGNCLRALGRYRRKSGTLLVGAIWLLLWIPLSVVGFVYGFAECAGGCGPQRTPTQVDWLLLLAAAGMGVGFNYLLAFIHSGEPRT